MRIDFALWVSREAAGVDVLGEAGGCEKRADTAPASHGRARRQLLLRPASTARRRRRRLPAVRARASFMFESLRG